MDSTTENNSGFVADTMTLEGENIAGRDQYIENNYEAASGFSEIDTDAYDETCFHSPVFTGTLAEQVKDRRLIVIAGGAGFDKTTFVRHLAAVISKDLQDTKVKEWRNTESNNDILKEILAETEPTVFILNSAVPLDVNYDLAKFASLVKDRNHYLLLTTEMTAEAWQQHEQVKKLYWFDIPSAGLYTRAQLTGIFLQKLELNKKLLDLQDEMLLNPSTPIAGKHSPESIVSRFETPDQIDFFFVLLKADVSDEENDKKISAVISSITDTSETLVTKWYKTLTPIEKLIALGGAMLEGLFDDQYFGVMQKIVEEFWHHRDKHLQSLDYCDMNFMLGFFKFEEYDDGRLILACKFPDQRAEIIRAAWKDHKRHILSAFAVLTNLAGTSSAASAKRIENKDISGTIERGMRLRTVAAETISDIGIVSFQTAEPKLLDLAAAGDETTRRVTAKAMARWRAYQKEEQMLSTLSRWKKSKNTSIKLTVVLTLRYAAEYDSPGYLNEGIIEILSGMAADGSVAVSINAILPKLIGLHAVQLKDHLVNHFAIREQYSDTIAGAFVKMYEENGLVVKQVLEEWLIVCNSENSKDNRRNKTTYRDNVLLVILKVYQAIPYQGDNDAIPLGYVWNILHQLHNTEQRKIMRSFVLQTAAFLIASQPEQAIKYIEPIFRKIGLEERLALIGAIGRLYLQQRMHLPDGEYSITVGEVQYPVWWRIHRPLTGIEKILYGWLQGNNSFAREIATLAFLEFARIIDFEEVQLIPKAVADALQREQEQLRQQRNQQYQQALEAVVRFPVMPDLSLWTRIKIFFWLIFKTSEEKQVMREMMRTLLMYKQTHPAYLGIIIYRWSRYPQDRIKKFAWWIEKMKKM
ncbi:MAG: hypothetical protein ABIQ40_04765 [Bacteroidia bacterium]